MEFNKNCRGRFQNPFINSPYNNNIGNDYMGSVGGANIGTQPRICREDSPRRNFVQGETTNNYNCECKCKCKPSDSVESENVSPNCTHAQCRSTLGLVPDLSLAMAYVPDQPWCDLYDCAVGFEHGTIFKQLDKPLLSPWRCR